MAKHYSSRSEDPLGLGIDLLERSSSALVKDGLSREALIFIVVVCVHAISELLDLILTELVQDGLAGGALIFSGEAIQRLVRLASILGKSLSAIATVELSSVSKANSRNGAYSG